MLFLISWCLTVFCLLCLFFVVTTILHAIAEYKKDAMDEKINESKKLAHHQEKEFDGYFSLKKRDNSVVQSFFKKYKDFHLDKFIILIKYEYIEMIMSLKENNSKKVQALCTPKCIDSKKYELLNNDELDVNNIYNNCEVLFVGYNEEKDDIIIKLKCKVRENSYDKSGNIILGMTNYLNKTFSIELKYNNVSKINEVHCKNCGAPIKSFTDKKCTSCGSDIIKEFSWIIDDVEII